MATSPTRLDMKKRLEAGLPVAVTISDELFASVRKDGDYYEVSYDNELARENLWTPEEIEYIMSVKLAQITYEDEGEDIGIENCSILSYEKQEDCKESGPEHQK